MDWVLWTWAVPLYTDLRKDPFGALMQQTKLFACSYGAEPVTSLCRLLRKLRAKFVDHFPNTQDLGAGQLPSHLSLCQVSLTYYVSSWIFLAVGFFQCPCWLRPLPPVGD